MWRKPKKKICNKKQSSHDDGEMVLKVFIPLFVCTNLSNNTTTLNNIHIIIMWFLYPSIASHTLVTVPHWQTFNKYMCITAYNYTIHDTCRCCSVVVVVFHFLLQAVATAFPLKIFRQKDQNANYLIQHTAKRNRMRFAHTKSRVYFNWYDAFCSRWVQSPVCGVAATLATCKYAQRIP